MATTITPQFIQVNSFFNAVDLRVASNKPAWEGTREGVAQYSHLLTEAGSGGNLSVDVSAGVCYVRGDSQIDQGLYRCEFETDNNLVLSTADATHPRVDRIVVTVRDNTYDASGYYEAKLQVRTGTPTAGATLTNLTGAQALTDSALLLADVLVSAGATAPSSISTAVRSLLGYGLRPPTNQSNSFTYLPNLADGLGDNFNVLSTRNELIDNATSLTEFSALQSVDHLSDHTDIDENSTDFPHALAAGDNELCCLYPVVASATIEAADTVTYATFAAAGAAIIHYLEFAVFSSAGDKLAHSAFTLLDSVNLEVVEAALSTPIDVVAGEIYWVAGRSAINKLTPGTLGFYGTSVYDPANYRRGRCYDFSIATNASSELDTVTSVRGLGALSEQSRVFGAPSMMLPLLITLAK